MDQLFVYGTLLRGEDRGGLLQQFDTRPAHTLGRLWRAPAGYPALAFDPGGTPIAGEVVRLGSASILMVLDLYEGVGEDLYSRIKIPIQTDDGTEVAWAYVMNPSQLRDSGCVPLDVSDWRSYSRRG